jgi:hypothetical protein
LLLLDYPINYQILQVWKTFGEKQYFIALIVMGSSLMGKRLLLLAALIEIFLCIRLSSLSYGQMKLI